MLLVGTVLPAQASVLRVPSTYPTLPEAIGAAVDGDTILVGPGVYPASFTVNKALAVIAEFGPEFTVLELDAIAQGVSFAADFSDHPGPRILRGFHVTGQGSARPVTILTILSGDYRIERCVFDRLNACETILVYGENAQVQVTSNTFYRCNPLGSGDLCGCVVTAATGTSVTSVRGNQFVSTAQALLGRPSTVLLSDYNCFHDNFVTYWGTASPGDSDRQADPLLDTLEFRIASGSPCIDAGDPDPAFNDSDGTRNDMGAFPYDVVVLPVPRQLSFGPYALGHTVIDSIPEFRWTYYDTASSLQSHHEVEVNSDFTWSDLPVWSTGPTSGSDSVVTYSGPPLPELTTHGVRIRVARNGQWGSWKYSFFSLHWSDRLVVPDNYATIQEAIDAAVDGDTVIVRPGVYREHLNFLGKEISVISEAGRDSTFIESAVFQMPLVIFISQEDTGSVLDGFTLRYAQDADGIGCRGSSPTIRNCDIGYCLEFGRGGRAIACRDSSPRILGNRVHHNATQGRDAGVTLYGHRVGRRAEIAFNDFFNNFGGAIIAYAPTHLSIHHNLIRGNFGNGLAAIELGSPSSASHHKIYANTILDGYHGLRMVDRAGDSVFNNILAGHYGAGFKGTPSATYFDYNDIWDNDSGNTASPNGLSADPLFNNAAMGDFSLTPGSPCVDAGLPDTAYNDADQSRSDMGSGGISAVPHAPFWLCPVKNLGDPNNSGNVTSADIIMMVNYCFKSGPAPLPCAAIGDFDCSGTVSSADIIHLVNYVFVLQTTDDAMKGGGDPPCNVCRLIYDGTWTCP